MRRGSFEQLVERAIAGIPRVFLDRVDNLSVQVEDWADSETLAEVGFDDPRDLLGFYQGWPLDERFHDSTPGLPDVITIYQQAVEAHARDTGTALLRVIQETVMHELAHHFGFSEEELDEVERLWADQEED